MDFTLYEFKVGKKNMKQLPLTVLSAPLCTVDIESVVFYMAKWMVVLLFWTLLRQK